MFDFYDIDSLLSEEERAVRASVRAFVDERVLPIIGKCYVEGRFPKELVPAMAELGVFGANLPEEYGCAGLNNVAYGLIMQELERGDLRLRQRRTAQALSAENGSGRDHRLLRTHRAGLRLEPVRDDHDGPRTGRRQLGSERRQDVDHERLDGANRGRLG
jgi:alkylation response protein AidB-like acyl-CoA dehydrogenase